MSKRKKQIADSGIDPNGWMVTFSDLLNLMLTFFVLLLSMSSMDTKQLKETFGFFDSAIGAIEGSNASEIRPHNTRVIKAIIPNAHMDDVSQLFGDKRAFGGGSFQSLSKELKQVGIKGLMAVKDLPNGIEIHFEERLVFRENSTKLTSQMRQLFKQITQFLNREKVQLKIAAFVERAQLNNYNSLSQIERESSRWKLAIDRSVAVTKAFKKSGLKEEISLSAYGFGNIQGPLSSYRNTIRLVLWAPKEK